MNKIFDTINNSFTGCGEHKTFNNKNIECKIVEKKIPKIIHLTYMNKDNIPEKVWKNLKKYCPDYEILFYSDNDCRQFLREHFGVLYEKKFDEIKIGPHKADFFRYCLLYIKGGVYMDIKLNPKINLSDIIDHNQNGLLYTCLGSKENILKKIANKIIPEIPNGHIFQAIIATFPNNRLMKLLIDDFFNNKLSIHYNIYTMLFYNLLRKEVGKKLVTGEHNIKDQKLVLFKEINKKLNSNEKKNCYGGYHNIIYKKNHIFQSRYYDYPWK